MAASAPSPTDVRCAPPAGFKPADPQAPLRSQRARHLVPVHRFGHFAGRLALATVGLLWAAGCTDQTLVPVGGSTLRVGLVGLWHFDETSGSTAADSSGNVNDGTLTRFTDLSSVWVPGRFGNALAVEAAGYVFVPHTDTIDEIVKGVTVSAWVYYEGTIDDYGTAISRQIGTGIDQYYHLSLRNAEGRPNLFISPTLPSTAAFTATKPVSRDTWVHLAGTYDGIAETLYVNGEFLMSTAVSGMFPLDTTPVILGGNTNGSSVTELFPGRIDEIALYKRALSAVEIARLAQAPVP